MPGASSAEPFRYPVEVVWRIVDELSDVIRSCGLGGESLAEFALPIETGDQGFDGDELAVLLNKWVKTANRHNYVLLASDVEKMQHEADLPPAVMPSLSRSSGAVAVVTVPELGAIDGRGLAAAAYAEALSAVLLAADVWATAWVFDLSSNGGGNMHPMLAGLVPVLGTGRLCGFRDTQGDITWVVADDQWVTAGGEIQSAVPSAQLLDRRPVAVVSGPGTLSSGEWVALTMRTRCEARSFGGDTGGCLTGVELVEVCDGAVTLGLTAVSAVDHRGHDVRSHLAPDVACAAHDALDRAITWAAAERLPTRERIDRRDPRSAPPGGR